MTEEGAHANASGQRGNSGIIPVRGPGGRRRQARDRRLPLPARSRTVSRRQPQCSRRTELCGGSSGPLAGPGRDDPVPPFPAAPPAPRPFGLAQITPPPLPVALGSESWKAGIASGLRAVVTRSPVPPASMSLQFGSLLDLASPLVEVTTHWDGQSWNDPDVPGHQPGAWELGAAEHRDEVIGRRDRTADPCYDQPGPDGPFGHGELTIAVPGQEQTLPAAALPALPGVLLPGRQDRGDRGQPSPTRRDAPIRAGDRP